MKEKDEKAQGVACSGGLSAAVEVFRQSWGDLSCAIDREKTAWEAYEKAGIENITAEMVKERQEATRAIDRLLRDLASKAWCAERWEWQGRSRKKWPHRIGCACAGSACPAAPTRPSTDAQLRSQLGHGAAGVRR